jgi:hypothetical protein
VKVGFIWHFHIPHNRKNCNGNSFCVKAPDILTCPFKLHLVDTSANQNCVTATNLVEKKWNYGICRRFLPRDDLKLFLTPRWFIRSTTPWHWQANGGHVHIIEIQRELHFVPESWKWNSPKLMRKKAHLPLLLGSSLSL